MIIYLKKLPSDIRWYLPKEVIKLLEESPKAVISKINGFCFTGGLELALAADLIYIANEAKLGDTHAVLGFRPSWGLTQRLPRYVGIMRAKELSFTAKTIRKKYRRPSQYSHRKRRERLVPREWRSKRGTI